ncbi:L-serine ammonia-lyase, iron-sulfur-dependent, subunit alpha [Brachyspira hyodysenteriae]|uniref:L-serine ammonia-lyase, iron-sulfur-dependent, subunit alpha n=1 Tax=Brachyspira hyodysenteriae TaxID=159 RepID=UPI002B26200C|nr:L-serine ammonia-lyase, iron-sulfur-dependent, subunit alpha [Brachyspira hyodysenteriae]WPC25421.1 L-serine ammonia-lyase, iron-sulfur-dependent, subunit alpha [Brachyspira hyodysenteriae]
MDIKSIESLVALATEKKVKISDIVIDIEAESQKTDRQTIINNMTSYYDIMKEAVENGKKDKFNFVTGLQNECVDIVEKFYKSKKSILGETVGEVVTAAMAVSGYNACMGKIIAAPTAGSCGVMPAVLTVCENRGYKKEDIVKSMFTSAGLADIIAQIATFAGAEGGCMAECGSAAGMAASACAEIMGATPQQCADAFALTISAMLGLICDPIAGFVEVPCMGKNVMAAVHAMVSAEMACAGFKSVIPADEVVSAMKEVGDGMDERFKETSLGGLANTPTGRAIAEKLLGKLNK